MPYTVPIRPAFAMSSPIGLAHREQLSECQQHDPDDRDPRTPTSDPTGTDGARDSKRRQHQHESDVVGEEPTLGDQEAARGERVVTGPG